MITLREAIYLGKLNQFIAEHRGEIGDLDAFNRTVKALAGKSKANPATSQKEGSDD